MGRSDQREIGDQPGTYDIVDTRTEGERVNIIVSCALERLHCMFSLLLDIRA